MTKKSDITKQYIIDSAIETINNVGIEKASINKILRDAKVSKGSFYYYFDSFDALMESILLEVITYYFNDLALQPENKDNLKQIGRKLINKINENDKMASILFLFISKVFTNPSLKKQVIDLRKKAIEDELTESNKGTAIAIDERFLNLYDILLIGFLSQSQFVEDTNVLITLWDELVDKLV